MGRKTLEEQTIKDDFMFGAVMKDPKKCKPLLEKILGVKIRKIEYPQLQKVLEHTMDAKSVRLDVYVEDDKQTIYNIEMQTTSQKCLPKRMRYYQGMIDLNIVEKGEDYSKLKKSYIIFICDYDAFGKGRHVYTFENVCIEDSSIRFGDDAVKIVLNTQGTADDVSEELKEVLHYIGGEKPNSDYTRELENAVKEVKDSEEWRREFMTLFLHDKEIERLTKSTIYVGLIRKNGSMTPEQMSSVFGISVDFVDKALSLIREFPEKDDENIAEMLVENID